MIPLKDNIRARRFPVVNYSVIGVTTTVFLLQLGAGDGGEALIERFGMIPQRVLGSGDEPLVRPVLRRDPRVGFVVEDLRPVAASAVPVWLTLLTCIFLHGGWLHFLGNMWFLHIFGDNVEDRFGRVGYIVFYLGAGVAASATHLLTNASSPIPTIGASGAIAGVMGAYFLLFPRANVLTLIPIFFFIEVVVLPAALFLFVWFFLQFFQGTLSITRTESAGVAWWAHIGGFVVGAGSVVVLRALGRLRSPVEILPHTERISRYSRHRPRSR
jgi:hypothetical protein